MIVSEKCIQYMKVLCCGILVFAIVMLFIVNSKEVDYKKELLESRDMNLELMQENEYLKEQVDNYYKAAFTIYAEYEKCMNYTKEMNE